MRWILAAVLAAWCGVASAQQFSPAQRQEIVEILREALRSDPSILRDALQALEEAETRDRSEARRTAIAANAEALLRDGTDAVKGNPRGDLTIAVFHDPRCGYCKQLHPTVEALVRRDRNVRVVLKDLPILGPLSVQGSRAMLAAQRQGKYVELYDALSRTRGELTEQALRTEAERVGLDWTRLRRDMDDPAVQRKIDENIRLARALGVEGTPALIIGDRLIPGAVDLPALEAAVAEARATRR